MLWVKICPRLLITLFHAEAEFPVISNLSQFNPHLSTDLKSSIHSPLKPLTPLPDLTYVHETILSSVVGFDLNEKTKVNNLDNL
jgi:hypothetical protein